MDRLLTFLQTMDRPTRSAVILSLLAFGLTAALLLAGSSGSFIDLGAFQAALRELRASGLALPAVVFAFCAGAFLGAPQFGLFAAVIAAFGPWQGGAYAWAATMVSSGLTFWTGRLAGERAFLRLAGPRARELAAFIGRNAFTASAIVRLVPAGPFVLVNMAFGASGARFAAFWAGTGLGIVPKIALVAFAGQTVFALLDGRPGLAAIALGLLALAWLGLAVGARRLMRNRAQ